ncbi:MAG: hypothetical protein ACFFCI_00655 [Promethearchaeota archaeon]
MSNVEKAEKSNLLMIYLELLAIAIIFFFMFILVEWMKNLL